MSVQVLYDQLIELRLPTFLQPCASSKPILNILNSLLKIVWPCSPITNVSDDGRAAFNAISSPLRFRCRLPSKILIFLQPAIWIAVPFLNSVNAIGSPPVTTCSCWVRPAAANLLSPPHSANVAARHGFTVRYQRTARLLHALTLAEPMVPSPPFLRSLAKINLLIIDDWMRDPITLSNAQDILEVLDDRFGHTATLIASQVPVSDWHLRIPEANLTECPHLRSVCI